MRIYIAGPYSADNVISVLDNIREGIRLSTQVLLLGHSPFCPWLDFLFQLFLRENEALAIKDYYRYSIDWLLVSDVLLVMPEWRNSGGTAEEIVQAFNAGIPIVFDIGDLPKPTKEK